MAIRSPAAIFLVMLVAACQTPKRPRALAPALSGTTWRVVTIENQGALGGAPPTLAFESEQRVVGSTGCNRYFAAVEISGSAMRFGKMGGPRRVCPATIMKQEKQFLEALSGVRSYRETGARLELFDEAGSVVIAMQANSSPI